MLKSVATFSHFLFVFRWVEFVFWCCCSYLLISSIWNKPPKRERERWKKQQTNVILGQLDSLIVVLVQILFFFSSFLFCFCVFIRFERRRGGCGLMFKIFDFLSIQNSFLSFLFVLKKEEQVYVCGDFSAPFAWNFKDGVTYPVCYTALLSLNLNLSNILLGLVVVLTVMKQFVCFLSVVVAVFVVFLQELQDIGEVVTILSIIVQVNLVVVAVMVSQLRIV